MRKTVLSYLSIGIGVILIVAGVADFLSYWFDKPSPWPWWGNLLMVGAGFLLLFPDRLAAAMTYLMEWRRSE